jgi:FkbM family methyltransferase
LGAFPEAEIYAFEPVAKTFITLKSKFKQVAKVNLFQLALGNEKSTQEIYVPQHNTMASLIKPQNYLASETVSVNSIDFFCQENEIFSIDLLKIDTEGYDLEVLLGAINMLEKREIKLILVEVGFNPKSDYHVLFDQVRDFLVPYGFALYGIYDQQLNWSGTKEIQYANVCFRLLGTLKE